MSTPSTFGRRTAIKMGLAGTAAVLAPRRARAQSPREVKIALVVPLSGAWARQGILKQMGAELAIDDVNKGGGIKALGGAKLKLVVYDTGDTAEKAKNAAQRLVAQEPDVVGGMGCCNALHICACAAATATSAEATRTPESARVDIAPTSRPADHLRQGYGGQEGGSYRVK